MAKATYKWKKNQNKLQQQIGNNYFSFTGVRQEIPKKTKTKLGITYTYHVLGNDMNGTPCRLKLVIYEPVYKANTKFFEDPALAEARVTYNGYIRTYREYINLIVTSMYVTEDIDYALPDDGYEEIK